MRTLSMIVVAAAMLSGIAGLHAQQRAPINEPYIKGTGATVPSAGPDDASGLDKNITRTTPQERRQDRITDGICKGC